MNNDIALPPFHIVETTKFTVEVDHEMTQTLRRYQAYYHKAYGASVTEADLLRAMAKQFMADDKGFQTYEKKPRRRRRRPAISPPAKSSAGDQLNFAARKP